MMTERTNKRSRFWDESVARSGHTGYGENLLHRYDQPVRLATVRHIISKLFPAGLHGRSVLDIGCGTGDFVALSASLGAETVDGIDISPQVLAKATARFADNPRIALYCGTVIDQVTGSECYDLITSITVLQHHVEVEELIAAFVALRSALKHGGRIIVLELAPPHHDNVEQHSRGMLYLVERPPKYWYAAIEAAGLRVICEPVMPQFGIACLRGINRLISLLSKQNSSAASATAQDSVEAPADLKRTAPTLPSLSYPRLLRRKALALVRATTLFFCRPLDHWFRFGLPPTRFRTYRVFVLGKGSREI